MICFIMQKMEVVNESKSLKRKTPDSVDGSDEPSPKMEAIEDPITYEPIVHPIKLVCCQQLFCWLSVLGLISNGHFRCPLCRKFIIDTPEVKTRLKRDDVFGEWKSEQDDVLFDLNAILQSLLVIRAFTYHMLRILVVMP